MINSVSIMLAIVHIIPHMVFAHGGGLDGQGGHRDTKTDDYHFHQGPLDGETFSSKQAASNARVVLNSVEDVTNEDSEQEDNPVQPIYDLSAHFPSADPADQLIVHKAYALQYSEPHEQAAWVLYRITAEQLQGSVNRTDDFRADEAVATSSASLEDYRGSGYDRGHMAPAAAMAWSAEIMSESFLLSNISPQNPAFNRGIWRELEALVRSWANLHDELFVVTGPVLSEQLSSIGPNRVSVPERYYKVILDLRMPIIAGIGFILPNGPANKPIERYAVTIDSVEAVTGIDFFPALVDLVEEQVESHLYGPHWGYEGLGMSTLNDPESWANIKIR